MLLAVVLFSLHFPERCRITVEREDILDLALFGVGRSGTATHRHYFMLPFILVSWCIYSLLLTQYCQMN
jgi:hypothetical protein